MASGGMSHRPPELQGHVFLPILDKNTGKAITFEVPHTIQHLWMGAIPEEWEALPENHPRWAPLLTMEILRALS